MGINGTKARRLGSRHRAVLAACLLVASSLLIASAPAADAQQPIEQVCLQGVYVDGNCEVGPDGPLACVPETCAIEVERPSNCVDDEPCVSTEVAVRGPRVCPDGASGEADFCYVYVAMGPNGCLTGSILLDGNCVQQVGTREGYFECPHGADLSVTADGGTCTSTLERLYGPCPASSEPFDGRCVSFTIGGLSANCGLINEHLETSRCIERAARLPGNADACDADTTYVNDACVVLLPGYGIVTCGGVDEPGDWGGAGNGLCESRVPALEAQCPAGYSRADRFSYLGSPYSINGFCFRVEPSSASECSIGRPGPDGVNCIESALDIPGAACPAGFEIVIWYNSLCTRIDPAVDGEPTCGQALEDDQGCYSIIDATVPPGDPSALVCPAGSTLIPDTTTCRFALDPRPGPRSCADPAAVLRLDECIKTLDAALIYQCAQGTLEVHPRLGRPICVLGETQMPDCGEGVINSDLCVFSAPFEVLTCPDLYAQLQQTAICERFIAAQGAWTCSPGGFFQYTDAGDPACWLPTGPQPGGCPDLEYLGECYRFVPHQLTCLPNGCIAPAPAPAAPVSERGDLDCNGVRDIRDALAIAQAIGDPALPRQADCAPVIATGGLRFTAGDLAQDGTVDRDDSRRLLQCLVDGTLDACTG